MPIREIVRLSHKLWPKSEYNRKAWVKAVLYLGDKWLLANPIKKPPRLAVAE